MYKNDRPDETLDMYKKLYISLMKYENRKKEEKVDKEPKKKDEAKRKKEKEPLKKKRKFIRSIRF